MICPECGTRLNIIDSRPVNGFLRFRVYKCLKCEFTDMTEERLPVDESLYEKTDILSDKFSKKYRGTPKEKQLAYQRDYAKKYFKQKRETDSKFKLNGNISSGISGSLEGNKNGRHWEDLVGYTLNDLKNHLEKLFQSGMTWKNYGEWHIDHKIPKAAFNFTRPEHVDFKKCWALKNLQPLWAKENMLKGAKLDKPFQPSLKI